jgi:hypothetical protein
MNPVMFRTFKLGPKNQKLESAGTGEMPPYQALIESDVPLFELAERASIEIIPEEMESAAEIFRYPNEGKIERTFELFEFPKRADYGRNGVDEHFVRDRLNFFGFRPATFIELLCFGGQLRAMYGDQWFESKNILALGSVATTTHEIQKGGWFSKPITGTYRHYPEFQFVAGRPFDQIRLSTTERDHHGNWPNEVLFLATGLL